MGGAGEGVGVTLLAETIRHTDSVRFVDGSSIELRSIGRGDGRLISNFVDQLSPESAYRRFLSSGRGVRSRWVANLINADQCDFLVYGAVASNEFGATLVAVAESIRDPGDAHAEFALAVTDTWQGRGIGTLLTTHVARVARSLGVSSWETYTMAGNLRMDRLMDRVGARGNHTMEFGLAHSSYRLF